MTNLPGQGLPPLEEFDEIPANDQVDEDFDDTQDEGEDDGSEDKEPKSKKNKRAQSRINRITWEREEAKREILRIQQQTNSQIAELQQQLTALTSNQQQQVTQAELNTAKEQLKEAFESGDYEKAAEISLKLGKIGNSVPNNTNIPAQPQAPKPKTPLDMYMESKHTWYGKDPIMTSRTVELFNLYSADARYQNRDHYQLLDLISKNVVAEEYKRGKTSFAPNPGMGGSDNYTGPNDQDKVVSKKEIEEARYMMPTLSDERIKAVILKARARNK